MDDTLRAAIRSEIGPLLTAVEHQRGKPCDDDLLLALAAVEADRRRRRALNEHERQDRLAADHELLRTMPGVR